MFWYLKAFNVLLLKAQTHDQGVKLSRMQVLAQHIPREPGPSLLQGESGNMGLTAEGVPLGRKLDLQSPFDF